MMKVSKNQLRRRGVSATPELVKLIEQRTIKLWSESEECGKLTRERRAETMGISARTADKLMAGSRVDRATLSLVIANLGIEWNDSLIDEDREDGFSTSEDEIPTSKLASATQKRRFPGIAFAVGTFLTIVIMTVWSMSSKQKSTKSRWPDQAVDAMQRGRLSYDTGDYATAKAEFTLAANLANEYDDIGAIAEASRMQGDVAVAQGHLELGEKYYREALRLRERMNAKVNLPPLQQAIGVLATRQGKFDLANQSLLDALAGFSEFKDIKGMALAQRDLGGLCAAKGSHRDALAWYLTARNTLIGGYEPDIYADLNGLQAMSLHALGRNEEAKKLLEDCLDYWTKKNHPRWIASTALKLGIVEQSLGNKDRAMKLVLASEKGYASVGDQAGQSAARAQLTSLQTVAK